MVARQMTIGPFHRGMNIGVGSVSNDHGECSDIVNWDVNYDRSLKVRNRLELVTGSTGTPAGRIRPVGYYRDQTDGLRIFFAAIDGTYVWNGNAYTKISSDIASNVWQYNGSAWVVMESGSSGRWTPAGGFVVVVSMPTGITSLIAKDILYIASSTAQSRIFYSKVTDFTVWSGSGAGFFDVNPNDGTLIQSLENYNDQVLIFKDRSIYVVTTPGLPSQATLRLLSRNVGTINPFTTAVLENSVVTLFNGVLFAVVNNAVSSISDQLTDNMDVYSTFGFISTPVSTLFSDPYGGLREVGQYIFQDNDPWVSFIQNSKVIVRSKSGRYFVLHTLGNDPAWTRYAFTTDPGKMEEYPMFSDVSKTQVLCGRATSNAGLYKFNDPFGIEVVTTGLRTRPVFSNGESGPVASSFDRLFRWGVSMAGVGTATGLVRPVTISAPATWQQLAAKRWNELATWENPLGTLPQTQSQAITNILTYDWIWFNGNMRGRGFIYEVTYVNSSNTEGARLFLLEAWASARERTFERVS